MRAAIIATVCGFALLSLTGCPGGGHGGGTSGGSSGTAGGIVNSGSIQTGTGIQAGPVHPFGSPKKH
jgi:hypothetical protein